MMQRVPRILLIIFIFFSLAAIAKTTIHYYGLDEEYNYFTAKRDVKTGKIQLLETGLILPYPGVDWARQQAAQKLAEKHFGYESVYLGCTVTNGIAIYNKVMEEYLGNVNGRNWRAKERQMRDSIMKSGTPE